MRRAGFAIRSAPAPRSGPPGGDAPEPVNGAAVLEVAQAEVAYHGGRLTAVRGVDLGIHAGETVAVVGESGSGKSSLVRAVLGLVPLRAGRAVFCGEELARVVEDRGSEAHRNLQLVFQDPADSLNPQMRVVDLVAEPLEVHAATLSRQERRARAADMLEKTGLGAKFLRRYPHELSGGQAQRVAIARALVLEPSVLVCDEAVAALDGTVREQILGLLREQAHPGARPTGVEAARDAVLAALQHEQPGVCAVRARTAGLLRGERVSTVTRDSPVRG